MNTVTLTQILDAPQDKPILIAGPTASGKSDLALQIAQNCGGVIVNADALQVYNNWRILSARPSAQDELRAPHLLYGHVAWDQDYSVGAWLRDLIPLLEQKRRPIIVGGTGLYFSALTQGLAEIPQTPPALRKAANALVETFSYERLLQDLDDETKDAIDVQNPMRVQRAWEVLQATGKTIVAWQRETPKPFLALDQCVPVLVDVEKDILNSRIAKRFSQMIKLGALEEARENLNRWDPTVLSSKAIGAPELIAYLKGECLLEEACENATIATRQFAKRQRTWFRSKMKTWLRFQPKY